MWSEGPHEEVVEAPKEVSIGRKDLLLLKGNGEEVNKQKLWDNISDVITPKINK